VKIRVPYKRRAVLVALALVVLLLGGCLRKATTQPEEITYQLPTKITVGIGQVVPGTDIRYDRLAEQGAYLTIQGQEALKRKGDSLEWSGNPSAGVAVDLSLRVVWFTESEIHLAGTAKIVVDGVSPREGAIATISEIKYTGPVAYGLAKGAVLPGSSLTYEGESDDGAKLGGLSGYPYRRAGDSIFWEGTLRDGVSIRIDVRVVQYDAKGLRVGGLVTLWIGA